jgi:hypothetical protein
MLAISTDDHTDLTDSSQSLDIVLTAPLSFSHNFAMDLTDSSQSLDIVLTA